MTTQMLAKFLLTAIAAGQGLVPLAIDLNRTHATNPLWVGHARFHVVQQVATGFLAGAVEVALIWMPGPIAPERFFLAAGLAATGLVGFLVAMMTRSLYGGTLRDPNGMKPARVRIGNRIVEFDVNVPVVVLAVVLLVTGVILYAHGHS